MPLITVFIILCVIGFLIWLLNRPSTPIDAFWKKLINVVVIIITIFWLLNVFGLLQGLFSVKAPHAMFLPFLGA